MARKRASRRRRDKSVLTKKEFYLSRHDEDKLLLFVSGMLFGVGVSTSIITNLFWFSSLALAAIGVVLFLVEYRRD